MLNIVQHFLIQGSHKEFLNAFLRTPPFSHFNIFLMQLKVIYDVNMEETSPKATSDEHIKKTFDKTSTLASDLKQHLKLIPVSLEILKENAAKSGNAEVLQYIKHQETPFIKDVKEISDLIPKVEISFHKMDVQMRDTKGSK